MTGHRRYRRDVTVAAPTPDEYLYGSSGSILNLVGRSTTGVSLRQSYERVSKHALIADHAYAHAQRFKLTNRALKTIAPGRVTRDIVRKIRGQAGPESVFAHPLMFARRVREQRQHQRGRTV